MAAARICLFELGFQTVVLAFGERLVYDSRNGGRVLWTD